MSVRVQGENGPAWLHSLPSDLKCKVRNGSILGTCEHFITRVGVNNVYDRFVTRVHPVTRSGQIRPAGNPVGQILSGQ